MDIDGGARAGGPPSDRDRLSAFRAQLADVTGACRYPDTGELREVDPEAGDLAYGWYAHADLRRHRRSGYWLWDNRRPKAWCPREQRLVACAPPRPPVMYPAADVALARRWAEQAARVAFAHELAVVLAKTFPREVVIRIYLEAFWGDGAPA